MKIQAFYQCLWTSIFVSFRISGLEWHHILHTLSNIAGGPYCMWHSTYVSSTYNVHTTILLSPALCSESNEPARKLGSFTQCQIWWSHCDSAWLLVLCTYMVLRCDWIVVGQSYWIQYSEQSRGCRNEGTDHRAFQLRYLLSFVSWTRGVEGKFVVWMSCSLCWLCNTIPLMLVDFNPMSW